MSHNTRLIVGLSFAVALIYPQISSAQHAFTNPIVLNTNGGVDSTQDGNVTLAPAAASNVWTSFFVSNSAVRRTRSTDNGITWAAPTLVQSIGSSDIAMASDSTGVIVAVWHNTNTLSQSFSRSTDNGQTWSIPNVLPGQIGAADYGPTIATDGNGTYVIVNEVHVAPGNGDYDLGVHRSTNYGATWGNEFMLHSSMNSDGSFNDQACRMVYCGNSTFVVVVVTQNNFGSLTAGNTYLAYSRSTDNGATWSALAPASTTRIAPNSVTVYPPGIATDGSGNIVAVVGGLSPLGGTDYDVLVTRSADSGQTWTNLVDLKPGGPADNVTDFVPHVATDGNGQWACVFQSEDTLGGTIGSDHDLLYCLSYNNGGGWSDAKAAFPNAKTDTGIDSTFRSTFRYGHSRWLFSWAASNITGADFDAFVAYGVADATVNPPATDFSYVDVTGSAPTSNVTLANDGLTTLTFTGAGLQITGADASEFGFNPAPSTAAMGPGTSRNVTVEFNPASIGTKAATLEMLSNDPHEATATGSLSGKGVGGMAAARDWQYLE